MTTTAVVWPRRETTCDAGYDPLTLAAVLGERVIENPRPVLVQVLVRPRS